MEFLFFIEEWEEFVLCDEVGVGVGGMMYWFVMIMNELGIRLGYKKICWCISGFFIVVERGGFEFLIGYEFIYVF